MNVESNSKGSGGGSWAASKENSYSKGAGMRMRSSKDTSNSKGGAFEGYQKQKYPGS